MVVGLDKFREHFADHADHYAVIGGTACSMIFEEVGIDFRQTNDIDMVLCVEVVDPSFAQSLKAFLDSGGYQARERSNGRREFYRFHKPTDPSYPAMLELFARKPEALEIPEDAGLTVVEVSDETLSLSAILLDTDYYEALLEGRRAIDDILVLDERLLIPFKARAFVDAHGVLWVVDQLLRERLCDPKQLETTLTLWRDDKAVFLPNQLIDNLLRRVR